MEIVVTRKTRTKTTTIGELSINDKFECYTLEDNDRGLQQAMPLEEIKRKKVFAQTAIPAGRYEVVITFSNRFQQYMPLLLNVPGFEAIRIHSGNTATDTEGCILLGQTLSPDFIGNSRAAFRSFLPKIRAVERTEKVFITIK